ncbi:MAG: dihydrodipicolinate reductase C-terminal domain-containing protein [Gemmatimonadota bacterium]|nr:dihydrodipicolinate reductase C-terminal domain-containing protein [Gemmatimonadota bacterium]
MSALRLTVIGDGKMGRLVHALAVEEGVVVTAWLGRDEVVASGISGETLGGANVAIEFTEPGAAAANVRALIAAGCAVVCGTTGWDDERAVVEQEVRAAGGALMWAPNFSLGVHIFTALVAEAARRARIAGGFDAHMVETHHAAKLDAPSGTARHLAQAAHAASGAVVPVTSVRVGAVPGTHELILDGAFEQLRLVHEARDRRVFALGALAAARWMVGRHGVLRLDDMLATSGGS